MCTETTSAPTGWALTDEQMDRLSAASERPLPYPYDVLAWASRTG